MPEWLSAAAMVVLGIAAMVLAVVKSDHEALSVIFAFTGIATAVFGLLLPRLEGDCELSATGFKGKLLRAARRVVSDDGLTLEEKGDALSVLLLDAGPTEGRQRRSQSSEPLGAAESSSAGIVALQPFEWPRPLPPGTLLVRHVPRDFESHVRRAFEESGWSVSRVPRSRFGDFVAERRGETLLVEVKAARHLASADVAQMLARYTDSPSDAQKLVLAVPAESLSSAASRLVDETPVLEVLYVPTIADEPRTP